MTAPVRILLLLTLVACGASQREQAIKSTLAVVNQTRDAFVEFDRATQAGIVAAAPSYERGAALLAAYRGKREKVVEAFTVTYRAIATAATANVKLDAMLTAAKQIADAFHHLKQQEHAQ